jgi:hypothetical protein
MRSPRKRPANPERRSWRWRSVAGAGAGILAGAFLSWAALTTWRTTASTTGSLTDSLLPPAAKLDGGGGGMVLHGTVDAVETDVLGRPSKVAIVSLARGLLVETAVEEGIVGEALKEHVGERVRARGVVKINADGSASFVVATFELEPSSG